MAASAAESAQISETSLYSFIRPSFLLLLCSCPENPRAVVTETRNEQDHRGPEVVALCGMENVKNEKDKVST